MSSPQKKSLSKDIDQYDRMMQMNRGFQLAVHKLYGLLEKKPLAIFSPPGMPEIEETKIHYWARIDTECNLFINGGAYIPHWDFIFDEKEIDKSNICARCEKARAIGGQI